MFNVASAFNSSDMFGVWINSTTLNFTGDYSMTFVFGLLALLLLMSIFKLPDMLMILLVIAPIVLISTLSEVGDTFNIFIGVVILYFAFVIWSMFPGK